MSKHHVHGARLVSQARGWAVCVTSVPLRLDQIKLDAHFTGEHAEAWERCPKLTLSKDRAGVQTQLHITPRSGLQAAEVPPSPIPGQSPERAALGRSGGGRPRLSQPPRHVLGDIPGHLCEKQQELHPISSRHTAARLGSVETALCPQAFGDGPQSAGRGSVFSNPRGKGPGLPALNNPDRGCKPRTRFFWTPLGVQKSQIRVSAGRLWAGAI